MHTFVKLRELYPNVASDDVHGDCALARFLSNRRRWCEESENTLGRFEERILLYNAYCNSLLDAQSNVLLLFSTLLCALSFFAHFGETFNLKYFLLSVDENSNFIRRQDRMTLNARNRIDRDKKLIFFIVGMGVLLIVVGLFLLLIYKLYSEDEKHVKPVIVIGDKSVICNTQSTLMCSRSMFAGCRSHVSLSVWRSLSETI